MIAGGKRDAAALAIDRFDIGCGTPTADGQPAVDTRLGASFVTARVVDDVGGVYAKAVLLSVGPNHGIHKREIARVERPHHRDRRMGGQGPVDRRLRQEPSLDVMGKSLQVN